MKFINAFLILDAYKIKVGNISLTAPNGGKCPNCLTGTLSFDHFGPRGEEYYSCVKCGFVVKK
jgi:ribosomal protein S27AE